MARLLIPASANVLLRTKTLKQSALDLAGRDFRELRKYLEDRIHDVYRSRLATDACSVEHCTCQVYKVGTKRNVCRCGHGPLEHCARAEEARSLLRDTGVLGKSFPERRPDSDSDDATGIESEDASRRRDSDEGEGKEK